MDRKFTTKLGLVIEINPVSISKHYPYNEIEYVDISSVGTGSFSGSTPMPLAEAPSRAKRLVEHGDTILATVRPNLRSFLYIKNPPNNMVVSTGFAVLHPTSKIDARFLYYAVTNQRFTDYLSANVKGAAYPAVDTETFARAEIWLPILPIQQKIAAILSAYDDLIENNLRRMKIFEEMAQILYGEWFVKLRFPGHQKVKMVDSHSGRIPEGWKVATVGDLINVVPRKNKIKTGDYLKEGVIPVIDQGKDFIAGYIDDTSLAYDGSLPIIVFGDHTCVLKWVDFRFAVGADGTQLIEPKYPEELPPRFLFYTLEFVPLEQFGYQRHFKYLKEAKVLIPSGNFARKFEEAVISNTDLILNLQRQNLNLRQTRDLLLPKLISGELDVSELDIRIEGNGS